MTRKITISSGEVYHIYNRGTDKRLIFQDLLDYDRFIKLLFFSNSRSPLTFRKLRIGETYAENVDKRGDTLVDIGAYCLMPNHFHLLIKAKSDRDVSAFMQKLCTSYAMYFNTKYGRSGTLFQGVFRAEHADSDEYLKYLFAYIHLNPLKMIDPTWKEAGLSDYNKALEFLSLYQFSSHLDYTQSRDQSHILNRFAFPDYFSQNQSFTDYIAYVQEWLTMQR